MQFSESHLPPHWLLRFSVAAVAVFLSACAANQKPEPVAQKVVNAPAPAKKSTNPPTVRANAKKLSIKLVFYERAHVSSDEVSTDSMINEIVSGKTRVLNHEKGSALFSAEQQGTAVLSFGPKTTSPGEKERIAAVRDFSYGTDFRPSPNKDKNGKIRYVASREETTETGVIAYIAARPTNSPRKVWIDFYALIREFDGFLREESKDPGTTGEFRGEKPIFSEQKTGYKGSIANGSFFFLGMLKDEQQVEDKVPVLGDVPLIGNLFRDRSTEHIHRLRAVQVLIEEAH